MRWGSGGSRWGRARLRTRGIGKGRAARGPGKRCICGIGEGRAEFPIPEDGLAMADETECGKPSRLVPPPGSWPRQRWLVWAIWANCREKENLPCVFCQFMERWPGQLGRPREKKMIEGQLSLRERDGAALSMSKIWAWNFQKINLGAEREPNRVSSEMNFAGLGVFSKVQSYTFQKITNKKFLTMCCIIGDV